MRHYARPAEELLGILEMLKVDFAVIGSAASSAYGDPRESADVDLLAVVHEGWLTRLSMLLGTDFYLDLPKAKDAFHRGIPFHIVSMTDVTRFHFYSAGVDPFDLTQLARKQFATVDFLAHVDVLVTSPEDVVLAKLRWYDKGGRTVERHWKDVLGVLRRQAEVLDWKYVESWAPRLGVGDLVGKLRGS